MRFERLQEKYSAARYMRTGGTPCMCKRPWIFKHKGACKTSRRAIDKARAEGRLKPQPRPTPRDTDND